MKGPILTLNAGSSSLKFALFDVRGRDVAAVGRGQVSGIGAEPHMRIKDADGAIVAEQSWAASGQRRHEDFLEPLFDWVDRHLGEAPLMAVGHRIVHGGDKFRQPVRIDDDMLASLDALDPLAPLHQPHNLAAVRAARVARPNVPQVACFDTAFHHTQSEVATRFALPRRWHDEGVRRYGFHGLSYEYVSERLRQLDPGLAAGRTIIAHLGNGASLCGVREGASVDTTMGFTALDGLMMGTRAGALDPGVILYLQQQCGLSVEAVQTLLYDQSGLLGVSGISSDMRTLLASGDPAAKQAIELYVFRIVREIGAMAASLGGLDGVVFTAGIGENAPEIRAAVAPGLAWLGLELDQAANHKGPGCISAPDSRIRAWVIPTDEETMIARHTAKTILGVRSQ